MDQQQASGQPVRVSRAVKSRAARKQERSVMSDSMHAELRPRFVTQGDGCLSEATPGLPRFEVKLAAADGLGFSVVEQEIPPGFSPPPRQHRQTREHAAVYVLQ